MLAKIRRAVSGGSSQCRRACGNLAMASRACRWRADAIVSAPSDRDASRGQIGSVLGRAVNELVERLVERRRGGEAAHLLQHHIRRKAPGPRGELREEQRSPDRVSREEGHHGLEQTNQGDRRAIETWKNRRAPCRQKPRGQGRLSSPARRVASRELEHETRSHRATDQVALVEVVLGEECGHRVCEGGNRGLDGKGGLWPKPGR